MLTTTNPTKDGVGNADPTVNHYVRKDRITRSIVEGVRVRAVCGEQLLVQSQGGGRTDAPEALVCPLCEWLYSRMSAER